MAPPATISDTVLYLPRIFYGDKDITVRMLDGSILDIWGPVFVNGNPITLIGSLPIATQAEAIAGTDNTKVMTPLRVREAGDSRYLLLSGGTIIGDLTINEDFTCWGQLYVDGPAIFGNTVALDRDPAFPMEAATKQYADSKVSLTGNQTIAGNKVFSGIVTFDNDVNLISNIFQGSTDSAQFGNLSIQGTADLGDDAFVVDEAYGPSWDGSTRLPTKNALYDKIETLGAGGGLTQEQVEDITAALFAAGTHTNATITYNDATPSLSIAASGGGTVTSVNGETGVVVLNQDEVLDGTTFKQYSQTEKTKLSGIAAGATVNSADATLLARANHTGTQSADTIVDGTTNKTFSAAEDTKLAGIATGATANSPDATLLARANHTGTQSADTVVDGSTNHVFTAADDTKLAGIAAGATVNSADATLLARANHTGTQAISTVTGLQTDLDTRVASSTVNTIWTGSQATYDGLGSYDSATLYVIT